MKNLILFISILLFYSYENLTSKPEKENLNTELIESSSRCQNDTFIEKFSWGERTIISLGLVEKDSIHYEIKTVFKKVKLADGFKGQSFIIFEKNDSLIYAYDAVIPENLPNSIINNSLYFKSKNCINEILEFEDQMLCFDCLNSRCLLKEKNVLKE